jgi:hypothetical protein
VIFDGEGIYKFMKRRVGVGTGTDQLRSIVREEIELLSGTSEQGGDGWRSLAVVPMDILASEAESRPDLRHDVSAETAGSGVISRLSNPETGAFVELVLHEPQRVVVRWAAPAARPKVEVLKGDSRDDRAMLLAVEDAFGDT